MQDTVSYIDGGIRTLTKVINKFQLIEYWNSNRIQIEFKDKREIKYEVYYIYNYHFAIRRFRAPSTDKYSTKWTIPKLWLTKWSSAEVTYLVISARGLT